MAKKSWRVQAHFPSAKLAEYQTVIVEAGTFAAAIGKAARELRKLPAMKKRKVSDCSLMLHLLGPVESESQTAAAAPAEQLRIADAQPADAQPTSVEPPPSQTP